MIISTLKVSNLLRFRGAFTSLKHSTRCICNTTRMAKPDHSERTATEPRDPSLHTVILRQIEEVNPSIRTFVLAIPPSVGSIKFLPGQWLDVFVPGISKPGGFTITSAPSKAQRKPAPPASPSPADGTASSGSPSAAAPAPEPYLELAVQKSPDNPPAQYLWRPISEILSSELRVRVGGSFVWPPPGVQPMTLRKIVFVAGGVGINPLMSIASHLAERPDPRHTVEFLYSTRDPGEGKRDARKILFLERLAGIFNGGGGALKGRLGLFLTPGGGAGAAEEGSGDNLQGIPFKQRRITVEEIAEAVGDDKRFAVVYVCGVPGMTDEFVEKLTSPQGLGLEPHRVLHEKWW
ncbi:putative nadh-cytochrome b-5 reductase [Diaporthe ampelina]|uniref:Putative nadh-cytochrome b-5 reductase n=1 Tax=Diaporthe ampelina TaxID=1214573 RepID=A0A0G2F8J2_9PEZI|nr:putative nadh-cytochrome b-5 reductase [Diaporthe ampelina]